MNLDLLWLYARNAANSGAYQRVVFIFEVMERVVERRDGE